MMMMMIGGIFETVNLYAFVYNRGLLKELMNDVMKYHLKSSLGMTLVYNMGSTERWERPGNLRPSRSLDSVILSDGIMEYLMEDIRRFLESLNWYSSRCIPYRRGYLLYGPPGNGKTSLVMALASHFRLPICAININSSNLTDERLTCLFNSTPGNRVILLIEDVDAAPATVSRDSTVNSTSGNESKPNKVTLSGLLNAIDGVFSQSGRILFMTTNYYEKLDRALYRPGRVDLKVKLDTPTKSQLERLFLNFYPDKKVLAHQFSQIVPEGEYSMAEVQSHFLNYRDNPEGAIENVEELRKTSDSLHVPELSSQLICNK